MASITTLGTGDYAVSIDALIKTIGANEVGKVLFRGIESAAKKEVLTIRPYTRGNAAIGVCNAVTSAHDPYAAYPQGVRPEPNAKAPAIRGAFVGREDNLGTPEDERYDQQPAGFIGTGVGSGSDLEFSPESWGPSRSSCYQGEYGSLPDEVLFHEMIHALRNLQGRRNPWPTEDKDYGNEEEFLAIVATNVYISAKGGTQLRANADGHWPLKAPLNTSTGFLTDARNLKILKIHQLIWQPTFGDLSHVATAIFNPFRELWMQGNG
jgi:hypothetical protein